MHLHSQSHRHRRATGKGRSKKKVHKLKLLLLPYSPDLDFVLIDHPIPTLPPKIKFQKRALGFIIRHIFFPVTYFEAKDTNFTTQKINYKCQISKWFLLKSFSPKTTLMHNVLLLMPKRSVKQYSLFNIQFAFNKRIVHKAHNLHADICLFSLFPIRSTIFHLIAMCTLNRVYC